MTYALRDYQQEAVDSVYAHLRHTDNNPCVVAPTGAGKAVMIAHIVQEAVTKWAGRILILAHVKELLEQNAEKIRTLCPGIDIGLYSAGLGGRDTKNQVIVAGIQSVYKRASEFGAFDIILIDEVHLLPEEGEGRYRAFLKDAMVINPSLRIVGFTATPFRLSGGHICKPQNMLNEVCYDISIPFLIQQGYLSNVISRGSKHKADLSNVKKRGGEFIASEMQGAMNKDKLVDDSVYEILSLTRDRKKVLIFTAGVEHCQNVVEAIRDMCSDTVEMLTGDTPKAERDLIISRFKDDGTCVSRLTPETEPIKYLCNVNVLTTGFDAPEVDCVVLLRATASAVLYIQAVGRGMRIAPHKEDCLVLDYGGNILRHGPIDSISIDEKIKGEGDAPMKECPECFLVVYAGVRECKCGFEFPPPETTPLSDKACGSNILSGEETITEHEVVGVFYTQHFKRGAEEGAPTTMRVEYQIGMNEFVSEWVCPEHSGWAREKFEDWWTARSNEPLPKDTPEAVMGALNGKLVATNKITVKKVEGESFDKIIGYDVDVLEKVEVKGNDWDLKEEEFSYEDIPF